MPEGSEGQPGGVKASQGGLRASNRGLWASQRGLRSSQRKLRASQRGLRASQRGLRVSQRGLRASQRGLRANQGNGWTYLKTKVQTEFFPILQDLVPYWGHCPSWNGRKSEKKKERRKVVKKDMAGGDFSDQNAVGSYTDEIEQVDDKEGREKIGQNKGWKNKVEN